MLSDFRKVERSLQEQEPIELMDKYSLESLVVPVLLFLPVPGVDTQEWILLLHTSSGHTFSHILMSTISLDGLWAVRRHCSGCS